MCTSKRVCRGTAEGLAGLAEKYGESRSPQRHPEDQARPGSQIPKARSRPAAPTLACRTRQSAVSAARALGDGHFFFFTVDGGKDSPPRKLFIDLVWPFRWPFRLQHGGFYRGVVRVYMEEKAVHQDSTTQAFALGTLHATTPTAEHLPCSCSEGPA